MTPVAFSRPDHRPAPSITGWLSLIALAASLGPIGCDGGGESPATPAPIPPPGPITVAFAFEALAVREGETVDILVRYQVPSLAAPLQLAISPLAESAAADDFELSHTGIQIPAGEGVSGETSLQLSAAVDTRFDEGDETVSVRFVPSEGVNVRLGADLRIVIQDGGVSPCIGVNLVATRPVNETRPARLDGVPAYSFAQRFFTIRLSDASESVAMEFVEPYLRYEQSSREAAFFRIHVAGWDVETDGNVIRHQLDLQDPLGDRNLPPLLLAFRGSECEDAVAQCSDRGCELVR